MSRRRSRRNSRRKSSGGSKQCVSPIAQRKHNKSNSVSYRDDVTEKGQNDSLRKENISVSAEEEEKYSEIQGKEKQFTSDINAESFRLQGRSSLPKAEGLEDNDSRTFVTSVTIDDLKKSSSTFIFQFMASSVEVKIEEDPQNLGVIKTTFIIHNQPGVTSEAMSQSEKRISPNNEQVHSQDVTFYNQNKKQGALRKVSVAETGKDARDSVRNILPSTACGELTCRKSCCEDQFTFHRSDSHNATDFTAADGPGCPSPSSDYWLMGKKDSIRDSFSSDALWDIPPPHEFANGKYTTAEDLAEGLAYCQIGACGSTADKEDVTPYTRHHKDSGCPYSLDDEESDHLMHQMPFFDRFSESDNCEPAHMRSPSSVSRTGYTKAFVHSQETTAQMRHNSIATAGHKPCPSSRYLEKPTKRRRTFPGGSDGCGDQQPEGLPSYRESFSSDTMSSFITQSLEAERLAKFYQEEEEMEGRPNADSRSSSRSSCSFRRWSGGARGHAETQQKQQKTAANVLYPSVAHEDTEEVLLGNGVFLEQRLQPRGNARGSPYEDLGDEERCDDDEHLVEQRKEVPERFDQDMGGVENPSLVGLTVQDMDSLGLKAVEAPKKDTFIQVIPPSHSGSDEHIIQNSPPRSISNAPKQASQKVVASDLRKGSVVTIIIGGSEQRFLQSDSRPTVGDVPEKHQRDSFNAVSEAPSVSPILDMEETSEVSLGSAGELKEDVRETLPRPLTNVASISSPELTQITEEWTDVKVMTAASLTQDSTDQETESPTKHRLYHTNTASKQSVSKSSLEVKDGGPDRWAKRRHLFKESQQWSSAGGSSVTSSVTEESEDTHSVDMTVRGLEDKGFYTETFHSAAWLYQGDEAGPPDAAPGLSTRPRPVTIRERTVKIRKGLGDYPWGFRIQFSKPIIITEVDTNSAAEEAGLHVGDYVLAVNGTDVTSVPHSEAADLARQGSDILTLTIGSDIGHSPNTPRPACRGYLHKRTQSGLIKGWRKRWFVLRYNCCLYYYRHKRDEGRRRALSTVKLEGAEVRTDASLGKPFVFRCCPLAGSRVYYFCATSNQEMKRWVEAMSGAVRPITEHHVWVDVTRHNASLPPLAVKTPECLGLLHQMDRYKDTWVQHYCILKDGCLYFYAGIRSTHALGGIYLHGYTVKEQMLGSKKSVIELKPPSEEFKIFYLAAENPTENQRWILAIKASIKKWLPLHQALKAYMNRPPEVTKM